MRCITRCGYGERGTFLHIALYIHCMLHILFIHIFIWYIINYLFSLFGKRNAFYLRTFYWFSSDEMDGEVNANRERSIFCCSLVFKHSGEM